MPTRRSVVQLGDWSIKLTDGVNTVTTTTVGDKKALDVSLTGGDIQIGAVEIKDGTSDARAPVSATDGLLVNLGSNNDVTATLANSAKIDCNNTEVKVTTIPSITGSVTISSMPDVSGSVSVSNMIPAVETGLATSDKQLADGHNVNVSNMIPAVETGLATSSNQLVLNSYSTNEVSSTVASVTYVGKEKGDGSWCVMKLDETTGMVITYATVTNNAGVTTYSDAWTNKATLTYNVYSVAF